MMSLSIKGSKYKIKRADLSSHGDDGQLLKCSKTILIEKTLKGHEFYHALLHELGHALAHEISLDQAIPSELEEIIVDNFALFFLDLKKRKALWKLSA